MDTNIRTVELNKLNMEDLYLSNNNILNVIHDDTNFYLKVFLKQNSQTLFAFSNAARDPKKSKPPFFSRSSWQKEIKSHCIFIDDPTLHNTNLRVGWGIGKKNHYYLETISKIIKKIQLLLFIHSYNTFYIGSSAGGYMSLMLASMHRDTTAIVNNPQFEVKEERAMSFINKMYPEMTQEDIIQEYAEKFSFYKMINKTNYFPNIKYLLNRYSKIDIDYQYLPLIKFLDETKIHSEKLEIIQYHSNKGHGGMYGKDRTVELLNGIILNKLGIKNFHKISEIYCKQELFTIYNEKSKPLDSIIFTNRLFIPINMFKKGYSAILQSKFKQKSGMLKLKVKSSYYSKIGVGNLKYEIIKNNTPISVEDMAMWSKTNEICIFNLKENDVISIKVSALTNKNNKSWSQASILEILEYEEINVKTYLDQSITFTSPVMTKL